MVHRAIAAPSHQTIACLTALDVTPLVEVRMPEGGPTIWCKAEYLHPSGSTKDRIACHILSKAMRDGRIRPGDEVVEASSGSTSIAMSMVCARLGLRFRAFMPEGVSRERSVMIRAYGGEVELTPREKGIVGSLEAAREWARCNGSFEPRQFENPDNAEAHRVAPLPRCCGRFLVGAWMRMSLAWEPVARWWGCVSDSRTRGCGHGPSRRVRWRAVPAPAATALRRSSSAASPRAFPACSMA